MNIFVTGGTGFIGSYFLNAAIAAGHHVTCQRRSASSSPRIKLQKEPVWATVTLSDIKPFHLQNTDVIVHFAAHGMPPQKSDWLTCFDVNVVQQLKLLQCAKQAGISNVVIAGSFSEYGDSGLRYERIPATAPLEPKGDYATSKAAGSVAAIGFCIDQNIKLSYLRIFSAYGDGQFHNNLYPSLKTAASKGEDFPMTLGEQVRDFIPVEEVAKQFLSECLYLYTKQGVALGKARVLNVGTGVPQTLRAFSERLWRQWDARGKLLLGAIPYRQNEVMRYVPEIN